MGLTATDLALWSGLTDLARQTIANIKSSTLSQTSRTSMGCARKPHVYLDLRDNGGFMVRTTVVVYLTYLASLLNKIQFY